MAPQSTSFYLLWSTYRRVPPQRLRGRSRAPLKMLSMPPRRAQPMAPHKQKRGPPGPLLPLNNHSQTKLRWRDAPLIRNLISPRVYSCQRYQLPV